MCARFEQLRIEFTVPRPSELLGLRSGPEERLDVNQPVASEDRPATASEYRAVLAAWRARTASADTGSGGPAATVIRTPALRQPARARVEAPTAAEPATTEIQPSAAAEVEHTPGAETEPVRPPLRLVSWDDDTAFELVEPPPEPVAAELDLAPVAEGEPETVAAEMGAEPVIDEVGPEAEPVAAEVEPEREPRARRKGRPMAALTSESPAPPSKSRARRKDRATAAPTQNSARSLSAATKENTALSAFGAPRVTRARPIRDHAVSSHREVMPQPVIGLVVAAIGGLIGGVSVLLLLSLTR